MITPKPLRLMLFAAALSSLMAIAPVVAQTPQTPPPGARSPLSPPENNRTQAEAFQRGYEAYYRGEYERAASIWSRLADQGHAKSMNNLGTMYVQGKGVGRNYALGLAYYRRAAEQNDARAAYNIGLAYENGRGVTKDDVSAVAWYRKAADRGLTEGMNAMAWVLATSPNGRVRNGSEALRWAQAAQQRENSARHLATLAAAHAELGSFREAVRTIEDAIALKQREVDGAGLVRSGRDSTGLLRNAGGIDSLAAMQARREAYQRGEATRD